jgi:anti-sigma-K factor RskA
VTEDVHVLAGAYVLGALDPDEEARFVAHLEGCAACRAEVDGFSAVRDELGRAAAEPAPPGLRERALAEAAGTAQEPMLLASRAARRDRSRSVIRGLLAAAAAVVLVVGGIAYARVRADRSSAQALVDVLTAPDAETVRLVGDDPADMRVVWSPTEGAAVLVADELGGPGEGRDFELWFLAGQAAVPALVFEPEDGRVKRRFDVPAEGFEALAVTIEPDGGSQEPTLPPVFTSAS